MNFLLLDIGGTKTRLGVSNGHEVEKIVTIQTAKNFERAMRDIAAATKKLTKQKIAGVVAGLPGGMNTGGQTLMAAPNLKAWIGKPIGASFAKMFRTKKIILENDANLAALAEALYGAGRGYQIVAYLGIGTGVGGALIVEGRIDRGRKNYSPGHQVIDIGSKAKCNCGLRGDLESLISGSGLVRQYKKPVKNLSATVWKKSAVYLGAGLNNVTTMWAPDMIVLGGSVMESLKPHLSIIKEGLRFRHAHPTITLARLGDTNGIYGALALVRQKFLNI